ncbi:MAG: T9SS type A sorting domain-containing protein [Candidatus Kapabacteria bacterium]|jgi:hypothetical protein|nr:T9SS type A sorting domain-containing protein [Candidatus Kapabacteria bacterium]
MLQRCLILALFFAFSFGASSLYAETFHTNTVNAVLGDVSFVKKFGAKPTSRTNERLRLQTHLEYVETMLRAKDVSHLPKALQVRRAMLLEKLREYRLAGCFPTNVAYKERRPCFIDAAGTICAVGYLIEQTAGRALAERINAAHQYDFLADMQMPELAAWVAASGLTVRECAMIQPGYGPPRIDTNIRFAITPSSTAATGTAYTMIISITGMLDRSYRPSTTNTYIRPVNIVWRALSFSPQIPISQRTGTYSTAPTFSSGGWRWSSIDTLFIPAASNVTAATYTVTLGVFEGIGDGFYNTTTFTVSPATSTRDLTLPPPITLSPNPVHEALTLALPENDLHTIRLRTALGTSVSALSDASGATTLAMDGLAAGVYFVEVESRTTRRRWVQKVVKY